MVHSIFIEEDVDRMIKLWVLQKSQDKLIWLLESSGTFIVKCTFHAQNSIIILQKMLSFGKGYRDLNYIID